MGRSSHWPPAPHGPQRPAAHYAPTPPAPVRAPLAMRPPLVRRPLPQPALEGVTDGLSVAIVTLRREPMFGPMFAALARSLGALRAVGVPCELLVVDGQLWYMEDRRSEVAALHSATLAPLDVDLVHVEPKPTVWQGPHRLTQGDLWAKASASNTAFVHARHSVVAMLDDCELVDPKWAAWHFDVGCQGYAGLGPFVYYAPGTEVREGRVVSGTPQGAPDARMAGLRPGPLPPELAPFCGGNASVPLWAALQANGFNEVMDGARGLEDSEFGIRVARLCPLAWNPAIPVHQLTDTHEPFAFECERADGESIEGGSWRAEGVRQRQCKYFEEDIGGQVHKMTWNHKVPRALLVDRTRILPANPHQPDLAALRSLVRAGRPLPVPTEPTRDWRDRQWLQEMR